MLRDLPDDHTASMRTTETCDLGWNGGIVCSPGGALLAERTGFRRELMKTTGMRRRDAEKLSAVDDVFRTGDWIGAWWRMRRAHHGVEWHGDGRENHAYEAEVKRAAAAGVAGRLAAELPLPSELEPYAGPANGNGAALDRARQVEESLPALRAVEAWALDEKGEMRRLPEPWKGNAERARNNLTRARKLIEDLTEPDQCAALAETRRGESGTPRLRAIRERLRQAAKIVGEVETQTHGTEAAEERRTA